MKFEVDSRSSLGLFDRFVAVADIERIERVQYEYL